MLKHYTKENSGLKNNYVLDMAEYNGNIWLATDGSGINLFTPRTFQFSQLQHIVGGLFFLTGQFHNLVVQGHER